MQSYGKTPTDFPGDSKVESMGVWPFILVDQSAQIPLPPKSISLELQPLKIYCSVTGALHGEWDNSVFLPKQHEALKILDSAKVWVKNTLFCSFMLTRRLTRG